VFYSIPFQIWQGGVVQRDLALIVLGVWMSGPPGEPAPGKLLGPVRRRSRRSHVRDPGCRRKRRGSAALGLSKCLPCTLFLSSSSSEGCVAPY